jgi:hypothetical protein
MRWPRTVQLCCHCHQRAAGFWVSARDARTVRRPWCLTCLEALDQDSVTVVPFGEPPGT